MAMIREDLKEKEIRLKEKKVNQAEIDLYED